LSNYKDKRDYFDLMIVFYLQIIVKVVSV
jgi:hypothetical protein